MENVFYKSYKELVSEYFGIDYKVGENEPKLSKQLSRAKIAYEQEELQAFAELLLMEIMQKFKVTTTVQMIVLVWNVFGQNIIQNTF